MGNDEKPAPKRTGRPPKNPELGKRSNIMFRLNEARKEQLMAAAADCGRSMSEEIEARVEKSFENAHRDDLIKSILGGGILSAVMKDIHVACARVMTPEPGSPSFELERRMLMSAIQKIVEHHLPNATPLSEPIQRDEKWEGLCRRAEETGVLVAQGVLNDALAGQVSALRAEAQDTVRRSAGDRQSPSFDFGMMKEAASENAQQVPAPTRSVKTK